MLKIRLQRVGRKAEPSFRLVLTDSKNSTKSGKYLEILGNYDARRGEKSEFKADRISHWISKGAGVSDTVHNLLVTKKIINAKKINKLPLKKAIVKESAEAPVAPTAPATEAPAEAPVAETAPETAPEEVKAEETPAEATA
jgi:small subunit ribosomal protein S16